jgi:FkbM family methyltransferase
MKKIILDCGSHLGESVIKFRSMFPDTELEIYMFEPNTHLYNIFNSNSEFNNCKKFNKAISNKNEIVKLWGCTKNKNSVGSSLEKSKAVTDKIEENDYIEIESIDLSDFINKNFLKEDYIILKLDIEGAEYDTLERLFETSVIHFINEIYCEFHSQWLAPDFSQREDNIRKKLEEINLQINYWDAL